jgi:hypothetical protein
MLSGKRGEKVMPLLNDVISWCKKERERLRQQEVLLARPKIQAGEKQNGRGDMEATSYLLPRTLESVRERIAELDALIARHRG